MSETMPTKEHMDAMIEAYNQWLAEPISKESDLVLLRTLGQIGQVVAHTVVEQFRSLTGNRSATLEDVMTYVGEAEGESYSETTAYQFVLILCGWIDEWHLYAELESESA